MSAKVIKTLVVSGLGTYKILEAPIINGTSAPEIDNTTFEDLYKAKVPEPQVELSSITIRVVSEGANAVPLSIPIAGEEATISIAGQYVDGGAYSNSVQGFISQVTPQTISVGGERIPSFEVEFTPSGGGTTTTGSTTTTAIE